MQPNSPNNILTNGPENKPRPNTHTKILLGILIFAIILAIAALIWGIIGQVHKTSEISKLQQELDTANQKLSESSNAKPTVERDISPYIDNGYFYVPKWNVKFKLSDELTDYGYAVAQNSLSNSFGEYELGMSAVQKSSLLEHPQARYYDDIFTCSIVTVSRVEANSPLIDTVPPIEGMTKVVNFGEHTFIMYNYKAHGSCDFETDLQQTSDMLMNIFSQPETI